MPALVIPQDGRLTSQNVLTGPLDSSAVMYIVSPGNVAHGSSYQVSLNTLGTFFGSFGTPTIVLAGPYASVSTDTRILLDYTVAAPTTLTMLASSSYTQPILIKDINGSLSGVNTTTISFSGGQLADGQATIVLQTAYAGIWLNPLQAGGFYITMA